MDGVVPRHDSVTAHDSVFLFIFGDFSEFHGCFFGIRVKRMNPGACAKTQMACINLFAASGSPA